MPNGGVPTHMVMKPKVGDGAVLHCETTTLSVYRSDDWINSRTDATPVTRLDRDEALVLARFLSYWLHDDGVGDVMYKMAGVDVAFDV